MTITLTALLFVVCGHYSSEENKECRQWLTRCINEKLHEEYYLQYEKEIRKARVFEGCMVKSGFKI